MGFFKPAQVHEECNKAAQILLKFVRKEKIPAEVIRNAKGVAIFTGFRAGMYFAGAGGSGVVVSRLPDGTWSPPSAFSVRSGSVGLVYGVDVYDCVCVLNTDAALEAYSNPEMTLGGSVTAAAGPVGGNIDLGNAKPVWTYTKSRGVFGGVTVDGTVIKERADANAAFYGSKVTAAQILQGNVEAQKQANMWPEGANKLHEALKKGEGMNADEKILSEISVEPTPADMVE